MIVEDRKESKMEGFIDTVALLFKKIFCVENDEQLKHRLLGLTDGAKIPSMKAQTAIDELCTHILGNDWYVVDPLGVEQVNSIIVYEIERKFKRYRKDNG